MNIKPLRDIDEHEVLNVFASNDVPLNKGAFVKIATGWKNDDDVINLVGAVGESYLGTVSQRYGVTPRVTIATSGSNVVGMALNDVKETDENGLPLVLFPKKAQQMQVAISGQAVPLLRRGLVLYSGITGTPTDGAPAYLNNVDNDGSVSVSGSVKVGQFLGGKDAEGYAFLFVDVRV